MEKCKCKIPKPTGRWSVGGKSYGLCKCGGEYPTVVFLGDSQKSEQASQEVMKETMAYNCYHVPQHETIADCEQASQPELKNMNYRKCKWTTCKTMLSEGSPSYCPAHNGGFCSRNPALQPVGDKTEERWDDWCVEIMAAVIQSKMDNKGEIDWADVDEMIIRAFKSERKKLVEEMIEALRREIAEAKDSKVLLGLAAAISILRKFLTNQNNEQK